MPTPTTVTLACIEIVIFFDNISDKESFSNQIVDESSELGFIANNSKCELFLNSINEESDILKNANVNYTVSTIIEEKIASSINYSPIIITHGPENKYVALKSSNLDFFSDVRAIDLNNLSVRLEVLYYINMFGDKFNTIDLNKENKYNVFYRATNLITNESVDKIRHLIIYTPVTFTYSSFNNETEYNIDLKLNIYERIKELHFTMMVGNNWKGGNWIHTSEDFIYQTANTSSSSSYSDEEYKNILSDVFKGSLKDSDDTHLEWDNRGNFKIKAKNDNNEQYYIPYDYNNNSNSPLLRFKFISTNNYPISADSSVYKLGISTYNTTDINNNKKVVSYDFTTDFKSVGVYIYNIEYWYDTIKNSLKTIIYDRIKREAIIKLAANRLSQLSQLS